MEAFRAEGKFPSALFSTPSAYTHYNKAMIEKAVYRIIDANFNRAREALRVMEEYCRFALNHPTLSAQAKQLRHRLCQALSQLPATRLIACRDSERDVGAEIQVAGQLQRTQLEDCLTAGCKRLSEALRALTESIQTFDPNLAQSLERLRFAGYQLEKDIAVIGIPCQRYRQVRLYVLVSHDHPTEVLQQTQACIAGGADCIQLRSKHLDDRSYLSLAQDFVKICKDSHVLSIVNDRIDIAVAAEADGVHLGGNDLSVNCTRMLQREPLIVGSTTHNAFELTTAIADSPTYIALGPAFATHTKPDLDPVGLDYLRQAATTLSDTGIGNVAIGGITLDTLPAVLATGVQAVAICAAVTAAPDPKAACQAFKEILTQNTIQTGIPCE
ncbi:thiamine phosphate synthase [Planctomycetota bacterium]